MKNDGCFKCSLYGKIENSPTGRGCVLKGLPPSAPDYPNKDLNCKFFKEVRKLKVIITLLLCAVIVSGKDHTDTLELLIEKSTDPFIMQHVGCTQEPCILISDLHEIIKEVSC